MSTYTPIASQTLGSAAATVTFSSIPQGYTDLVLVLNSASASTDAFTYLQFNNDTATNYSHSQLYGNGTSALSSRASNTSTMLNVDVNMETTSIIYNAIYQIQNYSNSTTFKTTLVRQNNTSSDYPGALVGVGLWRNTSPITTITIQATRGGSAYNFVSGSTFSLYGIQVGTAAQKAQGGNIVTSDGTYVYHTFTSSGTFIPSQALTVDYLVVAGGGGGGSNNGAGAGAGGLRSTVTATGGGGSLESALSLTAKSYPVIVGAGGAGSTNLNIRGAQGANSVFSTITSIGGGGGASDGQAIGGDGGSSGGGCNSSAAGTRTASPVQGFNGGASNVASAGGGGGGAGAAGAITPSANNGGNGGNGAAVSITGSSVTYAGGGGGGGRPGGSNSTGGSGGGGAGSATVAGTAGTTNTGGGGGAGGNNAGTQNGGNGGSGIVIIRYAI